MGMTKDTRIKSVVIQEAVIARLKRAQANKPGQYVLLPASEGYGMQFRSYERTVRDIREWDGRTVGRVRHVGAEFVVQWNDKNQYWQAIPSLNWFDIRDGEVR